ncbi:MAG: VOC family protein [Solirubrobacteraceae bacterium]
MDPVVHFELPAEDRERMAAFYQAAFGWETELLGQEMGNYTVVTTTPVVDGRPTAPGAINGGFFLKTSDPASQSPSVVVAVEDMQASMEAVKAAGGTVTEPTEIPGVGTYASFFDTEGNRLSMLKPLPPGAGSD